MNVSFYICILAGISLVFFLLYPADSTYGATAITSVMKGDLSLTDIILILRDVAIDNAGILTGTAIFASVLLTLFGASAIIPIIWNVAIFFVIPNLFILPTHLLLSGTAGLPVELRVLIMFLLNVMLLLTAIEFWR